MLPPLVALPATIQPPSAKSTINPVPLRNRHSLLFEALLMGRFCLAFTSERNVSLGPFLFWGTNYLELVWEKASTRLFPVTS